VGVVVGRGGYRRRLGGRRVPLPGGTEIPVVELRCDPLSSFVIRIDGSSSEVHSDAIGVRPILWKWQFPREELGKRGSVEVIDRKLVRIGLFGVRRQVLRNPRR